jgi:hypothetical protein
VLIALIKKEHLNRLIFKKKEMIEFIVKTKSLSFSQAEKLAEQTMKKMPAWQANF